MALPAKPAGIKLKPRGPLSDPNMQGGMIMCGILFVVATVTVIGGGYRINHSRSHNNPADVISRQSDPILFWPLPILLYGGGLLILRHGFKRAKAAALRKQKRLEAAAHSHHATATRHSPAIPHPKIYTLDICGDKKVPNPCEAEIRDALAGLDTKNGDAFLILSSSHGPFIQTGGDASTAFDLEYSDGDGIIFHAARDFKADEIIHIFHAYMTGDKNWKPTTEWIQIAV